jgi:hypothetical protein
MADFIQRLTMQPEPLSLNAQSALGPVCAPPRSQFSLLVRHFLERFFNHETASPDGDAKTRMVQIACACGIPGFFYAMYLWPLYHPFFGWPPKPPSYWTQVGHHFFFIVYSFVTIGIATVFEWDMFFPDLLDIFVLTTLPIPNRRLFMARIAAIIIFIFGFLFDANLLGLLIFPLVVDPPNIARLFAGHLVAVAGSGFFAAAFILALQGLLLSILGERFFRKISLLLQGLLIASLLMLFLLYPLISALVSTALESGSALGYFCPPFWFLSIEQCLLEGSSALPIYTRLAEVGCAALLITAGVVALTYPIAYLRRMRQLVEGSGARDTRNWFAWPLHRLLHATILRAPNSRAVFHFISQTLLRVQRYRIYLVIYGGVGLSLVVALILRIHIAHQHIRIDFSPDGLRAATGVIAFWTIAGLRMAFVSPGNRQGSWIFRVTHGNPPKFGTAMEQFQAAKLWAFLWGLILTISFLVASRAVDLSVMLTLSATISQLLCATGLCLLLTDILFLNIKTLPFSGEAPREETNIAFSIVKYAIYLPIVALLPIASEEWMEADSWHLVFTAAGLAAAHGLIRIWHRSLIREHCSMRALEDDEEEFPLRLGLRF